MWARYKHYVWPAIGLAAVAFSAWLLFHEIRHLSLEDVSESLVAIPLHRWLLAGTSTVLAYTALAEYDRLALNHLGRSLPWSFVATTSFTTYALAHNIGASVFSGAFVRYRAYTSQGLGSGEIGVLVALCSFTFALGTVLLGGLVLVTQPEPFTLLFEDISTEVLRGFGVLLLTLVALYVIGSWLHFQPLRIGSFELVYPRLPIVWRQLIIGPLELIGAAGILYFALPAEGNPGFIVVLGIFLASFSIALLSHAPGGLGVLEIVFLAGLPGLDPADVLAALIVFRLFYLIVPLLVSLFIILAFEHSQFTKREKEK
jgi:uncharacterized membrane protein YbhN (UPF0104 family)